MLMVIKEEHLTMQYILIALGLKIFEQKKNRREKNIMTTIYRIQAYISKMWNIRFIDF